MTWEERVAAAATRRTDAYDELVRTVRDAHKHGVSVVALAKLAGVTRPTIYQWTKEKP
jgi:DNA-binding XRE family transcriptional regulator